ncbi:zonular occludens toxin domain-containing protein [Paraburkholderia sediminicola]|uniref:zonular occludens toxin domain-containing protein n=1 Tax=Paraburkholderia sediminicola TaxID=458836 RepID=UPI0038BB1990
MAINVYGGIMGSGKSYEVVSGPLIDGISAGRRVVTNIDGVNEDRIHDYLVDVRGLDAEKLGHVVHVTTDRVKEPGFFPIEVESSEGAAVTPGLVEPGDLVVIDEAWKLWTQGEKMSKEHVAFFRMHRHFVHSGTGLACDVVLMVQDIGDLPRMLKAVVELSFVMVKLKALGASTKYRVEMYEGWKQNRKTRIGTFLRSYKKEIFPLYKSYAGVGGSEAVVDKRQNILANKRLWLMAAFLVGMSFVSVRFLWSFFHRAANGTTATDVPRAAGSSTSANAPMSSGTSGAAPGGSKPVFSENWRIVGSYNGPGRSWVVVADSAGRLRMESPSMFQNTGVVRVGTIDGEQVSTFSGVKPSAGGAVASPGLGGMSK